MKPPKKGHDKAMDAPPPTTPEPLPGDATRAAMAGLVTKHAKLVEWGCFFAVKIAMAQLTVHSRQVRDAMAAEGLIGEGKEHWLGAVFHELKTAGVLKHEGGWYKYVDPKRGIHERTVKQWVLVETADLTKYRQHPTP